MTWANGFSGTVTIRVTANGCNGPSAQVVRVVNITPTVGTPTAITVSSGTEPICQITNGTTTTTYATTSTNTTGLNWSLSNPSAGSITSSGVMTWANGFFGTVDIQVSANGCNGPSLLIIRTATLGPTVETPTPITITAGVEPNCQIINGTTTTTYATTAVNNTGLNWSLSNGAAGSINSAGVMTWTNGFSGTVDIRVTASGCNGPTSPVTIKTVIVAPLPAPAGTISGDATICQGQTGVSYTVPAIANATGYNWTLPAGAIILTGSNTNTITVDYATATTGSITVQGTNACGVGAISTLPIAFSLLPTVTTQPAVTQTLCATGSVSFSIVATGGSLSYQWHKGATVLTNGAGITGVNTPTLTINPINASHAGTDYYCVVSNVCGPTDSDFAALIVNQTPVIPNQTVSVCSDDLFTLTLTNGVPTAATIIPSGTTYSWSAPAVTGGITGGVGASNQTTINGTLHNPSTADQTATYTVTPTSGTTGFCVGSPFTVVVTVKPSPSILNINATVCSGEEVTVSPVGGSGNIVPPGTTYSWTAPSSAVITGATAASAQTSFKQTLVNTTSTPQVISYAVTATYGGCVDNTFTISITVNPKPTSAGSIASQGICTGSAITPITITNPNGVPGPVTYSWTRNHTTDVTGIPDGSGNTITGNLTNTTGASILVTFSLYATSSNGCVSLPSTVTVSVDPAPTVAASPLSQAICSEDAIATINITNTNNVAGTTFTWSRDNTTNLTGIPNTDNTSSITGNLMNITNVPQTTIFTVGTVNNSCNSPTKTVSVTVNPKPTVAVSVPSQTLCGGLPFTTINITNPNNVSGTTFSWTRANTANLTGLLAAGSGNSISGTLVNTTNTQQIETFTITATAAGCSSTTTATVIVDPAPLLVITPAGPISACTNVATMPTFTLSNSNNIPGTTYAWTRDKTTEVTGIGTSGNGNIPGSTLTNTTTTAQTVTLTVTATAPNNCSTTKTVTVSVYPPLVPPVIGSSQDVCGSQTPTAISMSTVVSGGSGTYTYQWQRSARNSGGPWTNVATTATYTPPATEYDYRLIVTDSFCTSTTVTSNVIYINVLGVGGLLDGASITGAPTAAVCKGSIPPITVDITHTALSTVKFNWTSNNSYVTPASGGPVGASSGGLFPTTSYVFNLTASNNTNATVSTTITVTPSFTNFVGTCNSTATSMTIQVKPTPVVTPTVPNTTICSASSGNIALKGNVTDAPTTFSWARNDTNTGVVSSAGSGTSAAIAAGGTFTIPDVLTNNTASALTVSYSINSTANGCSGTAITVTLTVAPSLTPGTVAANQTICNGGDPAPFTETTPAIGSGVSFQWQSSITSATGPWTNIVSATATTYDAPAGLTQTTWYQRVVTSTLNGVTCAVATAVPIQVTINTITPGSVTGDQTICSGGDPIAFGSVAATGGGGITYQWQSNTTGCGGTWSDIGGATSDTYDPPSGVSVTTYYRRVAISTLNGNACSDYSNCITVLANNVTAGTISGDQTTCSATLSAFTETVAATGTGLLTYQWQSNNTSCSGTWADISGATAATYTPSGVLETTYYHRIAIFTVNGVSCSAISNCITVTINSVAPGAIASNRTVCSGGDPAAFTEAAAATGTNLTYEWQMSTNSGLGPWTSITNATNPTYDPPSLTQTTYYQRIAYSTINGLTCSAASNSITVFVNDVTAPVIAGDQTVCDTTDPAAFTVSTAATGFGTLTYQWQSNTIGCGGPWTPISGATSFTYDPGPVTQTTYYQVVVTSTSNAVQCSAISNCVIVTRNTVPIAPVLSNIILTCNQATAIETWAAIPNTTEYRFDLSLDPSFGTFIAGYQNLSVGASASPSVSINSLSSNTTYYVRVRTLTSCGVSPNSNVVTLSVPVSTFNGSGWDVAPDATRRAIFAGNASITTLVSACSCQINSGVNVVVGTPGGANADAILKIENEFNILGTGTLTFENNASLIQVNDAVNTGIITYKRITTPMKNYDYTYWSSPVKDQVLNVLSPNTLIDKYFSWANGNWVYEDGSSNMNPGGKGFIIRVPKPDVTYPNGENWSGPTYKQPVQFVGEPYNGVIKIATQPDGKNNLIGNPYPSPIDADLFINTNASVISGGLKFWTHNSTVTPSGNFYVYNSNDYATYTLTGGTAATTGGPAPNVKIAAGQSFFVTGVANQEFEFNNAMRNTTKVLVSNANSQFFKMSNAKELSTIEKNRVWLNFANSEGAFKQLLVGYITGATNDLDKLYDSAIFGGNTYVDFYSISNGNNLTIQGRAIPFEMTDKIALGYKTTIKGTFTINIDKVDGLLVSQNIYLEDKTTSTIVDLKKEPYTFSTEIGTFNDRFVLRFTTTNVVTNTLGTATVDETKNPAIVAVKNKQIKISSFEEIIDKVKIYDLKTSLLYEKVNVNNNELIISDLHSSDQFLIMKILLKNGKWITKKILF